MDEADTTYKELFLLFLSRLVIETTGLDNLVINVEFVTGAGIHRLFDTLLCDKSEDSDRLRLTNTMRTILCLQISVRIPVGVKAVQ